MYTKLAAKTLVALALTSGTALTILGSTARYNAQLAYGTHTTLFNDLASAQQPLLEEAPLDETPLHAAAAVADQYRIAAAGWQLVMGLLLILFGFFLHALLVTREERSVRVTEAPKVEKTRDRWFWIEMKV